MKLRIFLCLIGGYLITSYLIGTFNPFAVGVGKRDAYLLLILIAAAISFIISEGFRKVSQP